MDKGEVIRNYQDESQIGDLFKHFEHSGILESLEKHILQPMDEGAFEIFRNTPAEETNRIIEAQMISKVLIMFRKTWEQKIQDGIYAKQKLKEGLPEGDE